ncbi:MAG: HD domain-containing protein [Bacteroidales bacterium]
MKLSNQIRQELSLQLLTSNALDQGLDQLHSIAQDYSEDITSPGFFKDIKRFLLASNAKKFFNKDMPATDYLKSDSGMTEKVIKFAANRHKDEFRDSGFPYLAHVLSAGFLLARLGFPKEIVFAAMLHDSVEDTGDKNKILNELYALSPAVAWYAYSVSGTDTKDAVEKDLMLTEKIRHFAANAGNVFPKAIKCADGIANLYDVEFMQARDGRDATERQLRFLKQSENEILPFAREVDAGEVIRVKNKEKAFSLEEYVKDTIDFKLSLVKAG